MRWREEHGGRNEKSDGRQWLEAHELCYVIRNFVTKKIYESTIYSLAALHKVALLAATYISSLNFASLTVLLQFAVALHSSRSVSSIETVGASSIIVSKTIISHK